MNSPLHPSAPNSNSQDEAWLTQVDVVHLFALIDKLLPLEACLYYQVLPLSLEHHRLCLGMVDLADTSAIAYVRRMLVYSDWEIKPRQISASGHRTLLTQYLSRNADRARAIAADASDPAVAASGSPPVGRIEYADLDMTGATAADLPIEGAGRSPNSAAAHARAAARDSSSATQATYIVDSPEELDATEFAEFSQVHRGAAAFAASAHSLPSTLITEDEPDSPPPAAAPLVDRIAHVLNAHAEQVGITPTGRSIPSPAAAPTPPLGAIADDGADLLRPVRELRLRLKYLDAPLSDLLNLPPKALLRELLGRVFQNGIGRLYLENHGTHGRIVWSQDGELKSVLEAIPPELFLAVIYNLKRFAGLTGGSNLPHQVELERLYLGERLLLRLRVMRGHHGEEATIQVLRGAALKFYNQQQLDKLGSDALVLAHRLQSQIHDIRARARSQLSHQQPQLASLSALRELLHQLDNEVELLMQRQVDLEN